MDFQRCSSELKLQAVHLADDKQETKSTDFGDKFLRLQTRVASQDGAGEELKFKILIIKSSLFNIIYVFFFFLISYQQMEVSY